MPAPFGLPAELAELQDDYDIRGELGRGGAAVVYHARDRALGREVAIKVVHPRPTSPDDDPVARLAREARVVAQLQHPNIVAVYAVRRLRGGGLALIMQLVAGGTLKTAVQAGGPLAPERVEGILRDVAAALAYAHARDHVHRDVKPENIFLDERSGRALLSDFGIARSATTDSMTMTGTAIGTPFYMSPEQVDGGIVDGRSDVYSLGLAAWEALTGRRPWDGESLYSVIHKQKFEELPPIEALRLGVPRRLQYLVERMLQKRPGARWAGAEGLLAQLDHPMLPADYAAWHRALPGRVERYQEAEAARTAERARSIAATPLVSASTLQFAPGVTPDSPDALFAAPTPHAAGALRPWVPEPVGSGLAEGQARAPELATTAAAILPRPGITVDLRPEADPPTSGATLGMSVPPVYADTVEPVWGTLEPFATRNNRRGVKRASVIAAATLPIVAVGGAVAYGHLTPSGGRQARAGAGTPAPQTVERQPLAFQVGSGAARSATAPPAVSAAAQPPSLLAAGGRHTCALTLTGGAYCWGANDRGQLGDGGSAVSRSVPATVTGMISFTALANGFAHSCALTRLGDVYCWGANTRGQLGEATTVGRNAPTRVAGPATYVAVTAGSAHSCAITTEHALQCWGANDQGQLGNGSHESSPVPTRVEAPSALAMVAAGGQHTCAVADSGGLYCWGANTYGQLGTGRAGVGSVTPRPVPLPTRVVSVSLGVAHSCAVTADGALWCWGRNDAGQLGDGTRRLRAAPTRVRFGSDRAILSVAAGAGHTCAVDASGALACWGRNTRGAIGDGSTVNRSIPTAVPLASAVAVAAAGTSHTCATTLASTTLCWGDDSDGQLGDSTSRVRLVPGPVHYPRGVTLRTPTTTLTAMLSSKPANDR